MSDHKTKKQPRPYIGVMFKCCHVYSRVYLNASGSAFQGWCPRCGASMTVRRAAGGSKSRFWSAG